MLDKCPYISPISLPDLSRMSPRYLPYISPQQVVLEKRMRHGPPSAGTLGGRRAPPASMYNSMPAAAYAPAAAPRERRGSIGERLSGISSAGGSGIGSGGSGGSGGGGGGGDIVVSAAAAAAAAESAHAVISAAAAAATAAAAEASAASEVGGTTAGHDGWASSAAVAPAQPVGGGGGGGGTDGSWGRRWQRG